MGTSISTYLARRHSLRVLDLKPPTAMGIEYVEGSITDPDALRAALEGCDSFINLVMNGGQGGTLTEQSIPLIQSNYAVNTFGLHLLLYVAQEVGIHQGVHTSTMSVHCRTRRWYHNEDEVPLDSPSVYGLTKGLGETICAYFCRWFDMNIISLRITGPRSRELFLDDRRSRSPEFEQSVGRGGASPIFVTDEEDLAAAYLAALEAVQVGHGRYDAVFIAGDEREVNHNLSKARRLLGWEPHSQCHLQSEVPLPHIETKDAHTGNGER